MNSKIFILVIVLFLVVSFGAQTATIEGESPDPQITVYVVPPITNVKILPTTSMSDSYISNDISIVASPGEYEPASFVIHADEDITSLEVEATGLAGEGGSIPSDNLDIRVVKCWYQGGKDIDGISRSKSHRYLTPELLLKDDTLVEVEGTEWDNINGQNYLRLTSGEYIWISEADDTYSGRTIIPISERPVKDSSTLQPVDIPNGTNKQFWVTVKVPDDSVAGIYTGTIELRISAELIGELQLELEVLPIELSEPYVDYYVYYRGRLRDSGTISSEYKNEEQFRAEMENLFNHGKTNPTVYNQESGTRFEEVLTIRDEAGMINQPLYYLGGTYDFGYSGIVNLAKNSYGVTDVYFWAFDEPKPEELGTLRARCDNFHNAGGKTFAGLNAKLSEEEIKSVADVLDLASLSKGAYSISVADEYHSHGHKISSYGNPQTHAEFPETFRRNYGLLLWQKEYDAAGTYAYQDSFDDIWNDFDCWVRDHVFAYPTMDGVIDTVQWEGWREGVDDVRYLTTLLDLIEEAKGEGKDTSSAESWLADLKNADLTTKDLDTVRSEMIGHILYLLGEMPPDTTPPVIASVAASDITGYSAVITWATDERATSQVEYGITEELGLFSDLDISLLTNHSISLTDLASSATYYYKAKSSDASGNLATSDIYSFTTLPPASLSISFTPPTDADNAVVDRDWTEVNTSVDSPYDVSSFIDWDRSLVGYWNFNENSGLFTYDKSSYENNGRLWDGPEWTTGKFGPALRFDGVDDYVDCGNDPSLNPTDAITIEAWVKPATISGGHQVLSKHPSLIAQFYQENQRFRWNAFIGGDDNRCYTENFLSADTWYHVVLTWTSDGTIHFYANGEELTVTKSRGDFIGSGDTTSNPLKIGIVGTSEPFNGLIDEVRIWSRALSPEEIKAAYNSKINNLSHRFTDLADGTYQYYAYTTDLTGNSAQTETRTLTIETNPNSYIPGDANEDGDVNSLDITKVKRIIMGLDDPTAGADANGDGNINALDMTQIELIITGG